MEALNPVEMIRANLKAESETHSGLLTQRWTPLRYHKRQQEFFNSPTRFNIVPAGRRSGKTEISKRRLVRKALTAQYDSSRFIASAPTHLQAKRIFWKDLKKLVPRRFISPNGISESELTIDLVNGAQICVMGMDRPERIEGPPIDHWLADEYGNMHEAVWYEHVRPGLADHMGTADLIGVPEGRTHYFDLWNYALEEIHRDWTAFTWFSAEIIDPGELQALKDHLDELTFQQECEGSFVVFAGLVYYAYDSAIHCQYPLNYQPHRDLIFCFDFNVSPGVCVVVQEFPAEHLFPGSLEFTGVIGEVFIPRNSNTPRVCEKLIADWHPRHKGKELYVYGDSTGGHRHTQGVIGPDWDIIENMLSKKWDDLYMDIPNKNPSPRHRVTAVNCRLKTHSGNVHLRIDKQRAPNTAKDFEAVKVIEGTAGEIDKEDKRFTHQTDAIGYYMHREFPTVGVEVEVEPI